MATGESILANTFIERLRSELFVDTARFEELCRDLRTLATEWKDQTHVEKRVVQDLYILAPVTFAMAKTISTVRSELGDRVHEMAIELDALVLDCLTSSRPHLDPT